jgi:hypothetical protein
MTLAFIPNVIPTMLPSYISDDVLPYHDHDALYANKYTIMEIIRTLL